MLDSPEPNFVPRAGARISPDQLRNIFERAYGPLNEVPDTYRMVGGAGDRVTSDQIKWLVSRVFVDFR